MSAQDFTEERHHYTDLSPQKIGRYQADVH